MLGNSGNRSEEVSRSAGFAPFSTEPTWMLVRMLRNGASLLAPTRFPTRRADFARSLRCRLPAQHVGPTRHRNIFGVWVNEESTANARSDAINPKKARVVSRFAMQYLRIPRSRVQRCRHCLPLGWRTLNALAQVAQLSYDFAL